MEGESNKGTSTYTIESGKVNLIVIAMVVPIGALAYFPFVWIWGKDALNLGAYMLNGRFIWFFLIGGIVHELIHGLTWALYAKQGLKAIKFGINWKYVMPYCHCKEPLKVKHYRLGGVMPLITMGIIPLIIGLALGQAGILCFGFLFTWTAGGDIVALYMLKDFDGDKLVSDHPSKIGFEIER